MSVFRDMVRFQWHRAGHGDSGWPWMVRWMPLRGSRMGGWFVMMLLGLPAATAATLDSVQRIRSIGQAAFVVSRPPEGRAWPLPQAGANNSCLEGDARDVRWAVDGRWLAVEMSGRNVDSLCLY